MSAEYDLLYQAYEGSRARVAALELFVSYIATHPDMGDSLPAAERETDLQLQARALMGVPSVSVGETLQGAAGGTCPVGGSSPLGSTGRDATIAGCPTRDEGPSESKSVVTGGERPALFPCPTCGVVSMTADAFEAFMSIEQRTADRCGKCQKKLVGDPLYPDTACQCPAEAEPRRANVEFPCAACGAEPWKSCVENGEEMGMIVHGARARARLGAEHRPEPPAKSRSVLRREASGVSGSIDDCIARVRELCASAARHSDATLAEAHQRLNEPLRYSMSEAERKEFEERCSNDAAPRPWCDDPNTPISGCKHLITSWCGCCHREQLEAEVKLARKLPDWWDVPPTFGLVVSTTSITSDPDMREALRRQLQSAWTLGFRCGSDPRSNEAADAGTFTTPKGHRMTQGECLCIITMGCSIHDGARTDKALVFPSGTFTYEAIADEFLSENCPVEKQDVVALIRHVRSAQCAETAVPNLEALRLVAKVANEAAEEALFDDLDTEWQITRSTLDRLLRTLYDAGIRKEFAGQVKP